MLRLNLAGTKILFNSIESSLTQTYYDWFLQKGPAQSVSANHYKETKKNKGRIV